MDDLDKIINAVSRIANIPRIQPDQDIYDAGLSSLKTLTLLLQLEEDFDVSLPDAEFIKARTARSLLAVIAAQRS